MQPAEQAWNDFAEALMATEEAWKGLQEAMGTVKSLEELSIPGQQMLAVSTVRSDFFTAMPRMLDRARGNGGLKTFLIPGEEEDDE